MVSKSQMTSTIFLSPILEKTSLLKSLSEMPTVVRANRISGHRTSQRTDSATEKAHTSWLQLGDVLEWMELRDLMGWVKIIGGKKKTAPVHCR